MHKRSYIILCATALISGFIFFAIMNSWIIIRIPGFYSLTYDAQMHQFSYKKEVALHFYQNQGWYSEKMDIIWSDDRNLALIELIKAWLLLCHEEKVCSKKINLESVLLDQHQSTAYVSFDSSFFTKQQTIFEKWMFIESLLKTINTNLNGISTVALLVHHCPLQDMHLDFSKPWPIQGFISI